MPIQDTRITEGIIAAMVIVAVFCLVQRRVNIQGFIISVICIALLSMLLAYVFVPLTGW